MCGKNRFFFRGGSLSGSPPRVREELACKLSFIILSRITPACAGRTPVVALPGLVNGDHPRVCGKNIIFSVCPSYIRGSPPRVREELFHVFICDIYNWITPACAGRTSFSHLRIAPLWDHPRVCGKNQIGKYQEIPIMGSPPRVREEPKRAIILPPTCRITPACAGRT